LTPNGTDPDTLTFSATGGNGIDITNAEQVDVYGNQIGTDALGASTSRRFDPREGNELGNAVSGISISIASHINIGLSGQAPNIISGNGLLFVLVGERLFQVGDGVYIKKSTSVTLQGNRIGTDKYGTIGLPNSTGVVLDNASKNVIGVTSPTVVGNLISGNRQSE